MGYLNFQTKVTESSTKWLSQYHQNVIFHLNVLSKPEELIQIHGQMIRTGLIHITTLASRIITYLTANPSCLSMTYASRVFNQIQNPNVFIWNSMIKGYRENDAPKDALILYKQMLSRGVSPDNYTYPIITKACSQIHAFETGKMIHGHVVKFGFELDLFIASGFVNLYASFGKIDDSQDLFDRMPERDVVLWTTMISGCAHLNLIDKAFLLLDEMKTSNIQPNKITIICLLSLCGEHRDIERGRSFHSYIIASNIEFDVFVGNALMSMYAKCGCTCEALEVFDKIPTKDTVSWNILIGMFAQSRLPERALALFNDMELSEIKPNKRTMMGVLEACSHLGNLEKAKFFHSYIETRKIECDLFMINALLNVYIKCGDIDGARCIFRQTPKKDVSSWTTLITGCVRAGQVKEALDLFHEMQIASVEPNAYTLVTLLSACANLGALDEGKRIHSYIKENNVGQDVCVGNALIDMYSKCGCIESTIEVFHGMNIKDTFSWNSIIGGLAINGNEKGAIDLFYQMQKTQDVKPDSVTLTLILSACAHSGMVYEGHYYFNSMERLFGIKPSIEHYGCMVDLLGRAGHFDEALDLIETMPVEPNPVIWGSLLAACRMHHNVNLGEKIAQKIMNLTPDEEGAHVLLSNMYAKDEKWSDVIRIRDFMVSKGLGKSAGCSLIEVDGISCSSPPEMDRSINNN